MCIILWSTLIVALFEVITLWTGECFGLPIGGR